MKSKNTILLMLGLIVVVALILANRREGAPEEASRSTAQTHAQSSQPTAAPAEATSAAPANGGSEKAAGSTATLPKAESTASAAVETHKVPHFHLTLAEAGPLPKILPASQFSIPIVAKAYRAAARIPEVLAQQPCYCWCEKMSHGSLVDCFATNHGAG